MEEWFNELEYRFINIIQSEKQREEIKTKKNKDSENCGALLNPSTYTQKKYQRTVKWGTEKILEGRRLKTSQDILSNLHTPRA